MWLMQPQDVFVFVELPGIIRERQPEIFIDYNARAIFHR
jgi:hypothetical protein